MGRGTSAEQSDLGGPLSLSPVSLDSSVLFHKKEEPLHQERETPFWVMQRGM